MWREERERIKEQKEQLEKQQRELTRQRELLEQIRRQQEEAKARPSTTVAPLPTVKPEQLKSEFTAKLAQCTTRICIQCN